MKVYLLLYEHPGRTGVMASADLPRVPIDGDVIEHDGTEYIVSKVTLHTNGQAPSVVARASE